MESNRDVLPVWYRDVHLQSYNMENRNVQSYDDDSQNSYNLESFGSTNVHNFNENFTDRHDVVGATNKPSLEDGHQLAPSHIGRVHRVSLSWIHERLGRHKDRDETVLFYQTSENMSADIYTKSFKEKGAWVQAQRLINIFGPDELNASSIEQWMLQREELENKPAEDIDNRAGWSKAGKRKAKATAGLATLADPGTRSRATQTGLM